MNYVIACTAVDLVTLITGFFIGRISMMSDVISPGPIVSIGQFKINTAEGALQFARDIKRSLNRMLPSVDGQEPTVNVLFNKMIVE